MLGNLLDTVFARAWPLRRPIEFPERLIMRQTQHRSLATLRRYIREGSLFRENVAARVGL
jgi:hypothetical protein